MSKSNEGSAQPPSFLSQTFGPRKFFRWEHWLLIFVLTAGITWRIVQYLLQFPIWRDEAAVGLNIFTRSFAGLTQPLNGLQVAPVLFLWAEKAVFITAGMSELSVRFIPLMAGIGALLLTWPTARSLASRRVALMATALVACSSIPVNLSCSLKPYSCDLFFAMLFLYLGSNLYLQPLKKRFLLILIAVTPAAIGFSFPVIFVIGGMVLALVPNIYERGSRAMRLLLLTWLLVIAASFAVDYLYVIRPQAASTHAGMDVFWNHAFPPINWTLPFWAIKAHFVEMMSYPIDRDFFSGICFPLCILGALHLLCTRRYVPLFLLLNPFILTFLASCFRLYPYGGEARVEQHLLPSIAILWAMGLMELLAMFRKRAGRTGRIRSTWLIVYGLLVVWSIIGMTINISRPYSEQGPETARSIVREITLQSTARTRIVLQVEHGGLWAEFLWNLHEYAPAGIWSEQFNRATLPTPGGDLWIIYGSTGSVAAYSPQALISGNGLDLIVQADHTMGLKESGLLTYCRVVHLAPTVTVMVHPQGH